MLKILHRCIGSHRMTLAETLSRLKAAPFASMLTIALIAVALALPGTLIVAFHNVEKLVVGMEEQAELSVYVTPQTPDRALSRLAGAIRDAEGVAEVAVISADESLKRFSRDHDIGEALQLFDRNPLPAVVEVRPDENHSRAPGLNLLRARLQAMTHVDRVMSNAVWLHRLDAAVGLAGVVTLLLVVLFAVMVVLVVSGIIHSEVESRTEEIEILGLLGAGGTFIRRPFFYAGLCYGLAGGLLAGVIIIVASAVIGDRLQQLLDLYHGGFHWRTPYLQIVFHATATGVALCLVSVCMSRISRRGN